jgi:hypothetical protein
METKPKTRKLQLEQFNQLFVVEYSIQQNASNVRTVNVMVENDRQNLARRISSDYVPVAIMGTHNDAIALSESLGRIIAQHIKVESERNLLLECSEDKLWVYLMKLESDMREE